MNFILKLCVFNVERMKLMFVILTTNHILKLIESGNDILLFEMNFYLFSILDKKM